MDKNTNNDLLILGISILIIGILLGTYSFATYKETKNLGQKIDFELIDDNNELTPEDKYYKYLSIADFLNQKLNKNKDILMKNSSCIYLNYAQHNAIELYKLTNRKFDSDDAKKSVAAGNIRTLFNTLDYYNTCKQTENYKIELKNILDDIEKAETSKNNNDQRFNEFLNGYRERQQEQQNSEENLQPEPIQNENEAYPQQTPVTKNETTSEPISEFRNN